MMSWNSQMEFQYTDTTLPYDSIGSFMDFFGGMAYDHLNYIFADVPYAQENSSVNTNLYKFGFSEPESFSYYDYSPGYSVTGQVCGNEGQDCHIENSQTLADNDVVAANMHREDNSITTPHANSVECSRVYQNTCDNEVVWQDNIDPDNMTYEELLELGEAVGTQSRGLSQDLISLLPVTKFKCGLFSRKRSRKERSDNEFLKGLSGFIQFCGFCQYSLQSLSREFGENRYAMKFLKLLIQFLENYKYQFHAFVDYLLFDLKHK
nr:E3 ubiquitin ligase BIG BROTHER-like [Ipomoea batatas]